MGPALAVVAAAGVGWVSSGLPNNSVKALAVVPTAPLTVFVGTNVNGVMESSDGGTTWVKSGLGTSSVLALAIDPTVAGVVYAATGGGVFKSSDGGATWASANVGLAGVTVRALAADGANQGPLYAGTANGVFSYPEPVVCPVPSGLVNNTAADPEPCAKTGIEVSWSAPTAWGDSGIGSRTFDVLRNNTPIATGLAQATNTFTDTTAVPYVTYPYAVRADNGCGLSATTVGDSSE